MRDWQDPTEDLFSPVGDMRRRGSWAEWGCAVAVIVGLLMIASLIYVRTVAIFAIYAIPTIAVYFLLVLIGGLCIAFWPNRWSRTFRSIATVEHKYIERKQERLYGEVPSEPGDTHVVRLTLEDGTKVEALCSAELYSSLSERSRGLAVVRGNRLLGYVPGDR